MVVFIGTGIIACVEMNFEQNSVLLVTWYALLFLVKGEVISYWNKVHRANRFLFSPDGNPSHSFCSMCILQCPMGYQKSSSGCFLCACATSNFQISSGFSSLTQSTNNGVLFDRPCNPAVTNCRIECDHGFKLGPNGCQYCACATNYLTQQQTTPVSSSKLPTQITTTSSSTTTTTTTPSTTRTTTTTTHSSTTKITTRPTSTTTTTTTTTTTAIPTTTASAVTTYKVIPVNVPVTYTSSNPASTTSHVALSPTTLTDPCIPSQKQCSKNCGGSFVKGPGGCEYCLCMDKFPPDLLLTTTPETPSMANATLPASPSTEVCIIAKVICNQKCPNGFISQVEDCLYCACDTSDTLTYDPDQISSVYMHILPSPCVQSLNECQVRCTSGYLQGPRDCEFCTCK